MQKIKVILTGVLAMILLVIVAFMPIVISKWNDNRLLNEFVAEKIESKNTALIVSKLDTKDKVSLLNDFDKNSQNYVTIKQRQNEQNDDFEKTKEKIVTEIKKLQDLKIIPEYDFNTTFQEFTYQTVTYAKATDPESSVVILQINLWGEKENLSIWIDGNDNKIYRYIHNRNGTVDLMSIDVDVIYLYGVEYLGLDEEMAIKCCNVISIKKLFQIDCF